MQATDLKNYLYDGGAILFVVYIGNGGLCKKIYYIELPPIRLRLTLASAKEQKSKTITLKEFPTDNNRKSTIFFIAFATVKCNQALPRQKLLSFEELEKQKLKEYQFQYLELALRTTCSELWLQMMCTYMRKSKLFNTSTNGIPSTRTNNKRNFGHRGFNR